MAPMADNETSVKPGSIEWHEERLNAIRDRWMRSDTDPQLWKDVEVLTNMYEMQILGWQVKTKPTWTELQEQVDELKAIIAKYITEVSTRE